SSVKRPVRELKTFAKLALAAGESKSVTLTLDQRAFAFFDVVARRWQVEAGQFVIEAGFSVEDRPLSATVEMQAQTLAP
ncbi:MAG TPA: fibronectin type III-like domain-contianing protein, partial [Paracoccaceae bacterium]|nr:fibronectin type III-like domain-contianing protein [Paracoccaceae bacterium]